jgi:hypothetical protein
MKKLLLLSASCLMLLSACKKDKQKTDEENGKKYPFTFSAQQFSQTQSPFSTPNKQTLDAEPIGQSNNYSLLHYAVYDSNGNEVSRMEQGRLAQGQLDTKLYRISGGIKTLISATNTFGSITDSLKAGKYMVVIAASGANSSLNAPKTFNTTLHDYLNDPYAVLSLADARFIISPTFTQDAALYKGEFEVTANISGKSITLSRIVGQLAINIEDAIPAGVNGFKFIYTDYNSYRINTGIPEGSRPYLEEYYQIKPSYIGTTNYTWRRPLYKSTDPMTVTIKAVDKDSNTLYEKTITNVQIDVNKVTTLSGKLFDGKLGAGFTVSVNPEWATGTIINF